MAPHRLLADLGVQLGNVGFAFVLVLALFEQPRRAVQKLALPLCNHVEMDGKAFDNLDDWLLALDRLESDLGLWRRTSAYVVGIAASKMLFLGRLPWSSITYRAVRFRPATSGSTCFASSGK